MIKNIVYHVIYKDQYEQGKFSESPRELQVDQLENRLLVELEKSYASRAGKGYGYFEEDVDLYPISLILREYLSKENTFYDTSIRMLKVLTNKINDASAATGGYVFIAHYEDGSQEYLLVALISEKTTYSAEDWKIKEFEALNIEQLKFAGRINITAWEEGKERYISFLKGKGDVAQYFRKFLACNDILVDQSETKKLVDRMNTFLRAAGLDVMQKNKILTDAKDYLTEISDNDERFALEVFANRIWPDNPTELVNHLSFSDDGDDTGVSDGFRPDKRSLKGLVVHANKTKHWSLSFDNQAIVDGLVSREGNKILLHEPGEKLLNAFDN